MEYISKPPTTNNRNMDYKKLYEKSLKERVADEKMIAKLKKEKEELEEKRKILYMNTVRCGQHERAKVEKVEGEKEDLLKFIAGDYDEEPTVQRLIRECFNQEFIDSNTERWEEVGLEFDEEK